MVKGWGGIMIGSRIKFQRGPKKKIYIWWHAKKFIHLALFFVLYIFLTVQTRHKDQTACSS